MSRKIPPSVKIAIGAALVMGLGYGGWRAYSWQRLQNYELVQTTPGRVNLVAVRPDRGWRIIVSNSIAQLAEVQAGDDQMGRRDDNSDVSNARRLPMREFVQTMGGDEEALGYLIERVNDKDEGKLPTREVRWKIDDIEKALNGDPTLKAKLEIDIQSQLDGRPSESLSPSALLNGIVIEVPVPIEVNVGGKMTTLNGIVREPYMSDIAERASREIGKKFNPTTDMIRGIYITEALKVVNGEIPQEDIARSLRSRYSKSHIADLAQKPQMVLQDAMVLVNDSHLTGATISTYPGPNRRTYADITINLTDEGRMRLWKYSHDNPGFQLLLVVDGIAYAAPRITTPLMERTIQITRLSEPELAQAAADQINQFQRDKQ